MNYGVAAVTFKGPEPTWMSLLTDNLCIPDRRGRIALRPARLPRLRHGAPRVPREERARYEGTIFLDCLAIHVLPGATTCRKCFVICFLKVPLACLGSIAATVQPNSLGNSQKT